MCGKIMAGSIDIVDAVGNSGTNMEKYSEITLGKRIHDPGVLCRYRPEETGGGMSERVCRCRQVTKSRSVQLIPGNQTKTAAVTYDIRDIKKPVKEGEVTQSGTYNSSRMADGYLYLFSEYYTGGDMWSKINRSPMCRW